MLQLSVTILFIFVCQCYGSMHMLNLNPELGIAKIKLSNKGFVQTSVFTLTHVVRLDVLNGIVKNMEMSVKNKSEEFKVFKSENEVLVNKIKNLRTSMNNLLNKNTFRSKRENAWNEWIGTAIKWATGKNFVLVSSWIDFIFKSEKFEILKPIFCFVFNRKFRCRRWAHIRKKN